MTRPLINLTLPISEPATVPLGICTACGYPGLTGTKCRNPAGCGFVADPIAAFIWHARIDGARLALAAAATACDLEKAWLRRRERIAADGAQICADAIRVLDPVAIVDKKKET